MHHPCYYLHSHNIIHKDLKPGNILLDDFLLPKICDFGLSKINQQGQENNLTKTGLDIKGTPKYMAPEVWAKLDYGKPCDVYGFAIILYEIMTTENPFESFDFFRMLIEIQKGTRPEFKSPIPEAYKNLIEKCWNNDPMKRPTFQEIVENLKNDKKFITEEIDEKQYFDYIKYIDEYKSSFNSLNVDIPLHNFIKQKMNFQSKMLLRNNGFYSYHNFMKLDEESKQMVEEAEYDTEKQFTLAQIIIEGQQHFEPNTEVGLKYLKNSINSRDWSWILDKCDSSYVIFKKLDNKQRAKFSRLVCLKYWMIWICCFVRASDDVFNASIKIIK